MLTSVWQQFDYRIDISVWLRVHISNICKSL
jgi:hypothetical protein